MWKVCTFSFSFKKLLEIKCKFYLMQFIWKLFDMLFTCVVIFLVYDIDLVSINLRSSQEERIYVFFFIVYIFIEGLLYNCHTYLNKLISFKRNIFISSSWLDCRLKRKEHSTIQLNCKSFNLLWHILDLIYWWVASCHPFSFKISCKWWNNWKC